MLGQTFELHDLIVILILVVLEGVLSMDNARCFGLALRVPKRLQARALSYGLVGAGVSRAGDRGGQLSAGVASAEAAGRAVSDLRRAKAFIWPDKEHPDEAPRRSAPNRSTTTSRTSQRIPKSSGRR